MTVSPTARHIGVCNFGVQDLADAMAIGVPIVSNQICYNLLCRTCIFLLPPPRSCAAAGPSAASPLVLRH